MITENNNGGNDNNNHFAEHAGIIAYFIPVVSVGIVGNVWVIVQLLRIMRRNLSAVSAVFKRLLLYILTLSVADICVLCMAPLLVQYLVNGTWEFGYTACKLFFTVENVNKIWSVGILVLISVERVAAVRRASFYQQKTADGPSCGVLALVALLFIVSVVLCLPIITGAGTELVKVVNENETVEAEWIECSSNLPDGQMVVFAGYMFVLGYVVPVALLSFCYLFLVRRMRRFLVGGDVEARVVRSVVYVMIFHLVCWTPFWAFVVLPVLVHFGVVGPDVMANPSLFTWQMAASFLPYMNSAGNWIFYAAMNRELRTAKFCGGVNYCSWMNDANNGSGKSGLGGIGLGEFAHFQLSSSVLEERENREKTMDKKQPLLINAGDVPGGEEVVKGNNRKGTQTKNALKTYGFGFVHRLHMIGGGDEAAEVKEAEEEEYSGEDTGEEDNGDDGDTGTVCCCTRTTSVGTAVTTVGGGGDGEKGGINFRNDGCAADVVIVAVD